MKKQLLILTLGASFLLANSNEADLLSQVTKNGVNGAQYELNNQDMEKVDGGYTYFGAPVPQVFYGGIDTQLKNLLYMNSTSGSSGTTSTTTTKSFANIIKPNISITYMRVSEFNSQFK